MAHVEGLADRRDAKKLGAAMLHAALIRHTVNKTSFSEQCYYVFCEQVIAAAGAPRLFSIVLSVHPSPFTLHSTLMRIFGCTSGKCVGHVYSYTHLVLVQPKCS